MSFQFATDSGSSFQLAGQLKQGTMLVVDDFDSMRKITINQLKQLGAIKIVEAANGAEALKILARQPITMVLSDWNMPVMSGLDLLLTIRTHPKLYSLPFLMITAEAARERVMLAVRSGVSELIVKPYTAGGFAERVEKAMSWKPRLNRPLTPADIAAATGASLSVGGVEVSSETAPVREGTTPSPSIAASAVPQLRPASTPEKSTILVVDDTPDNLHLLSSLFKDEYRVKIAHNGEKALQIAQSDTPPDLILLDIMMPGMDGFEVAGKLRTHPSSEHIPVIFVTAMTDEDARLKGMELGAVDFVTKPIDPDGLKLRVKNFMRYIELHRQLQSDYDGMMAMEKLKEDVEHITRHDMKGPLAGLIGIVQSLSDASNLTEDQREMLSMAEETALLALNMVNLSNELYKIESGHFKLEPARVEVADILKRIAIIQRKAFAVKNLTIAVATPKDTQDEQLVALGDPMLSYSLFQNLLKNACEAAPDGSTVTCKIVPTDKVLQVSMENSGTVPMEIRERFFDKFATAGKQGGTGIGTYSAKLLTEAQHGSIAMATSDEKNQTCITVSLPAA